jgi:hypothetical protein
MINHTRLVIHALEARCHHARCIRYAGDSNIANKGKVSNPSHERSIMIERRLGRRIKRRTSKETTCCIDSPTCAVHILHLGDSTVDLFLPLSLSRPLPPFSMCACEHDCPRRKSVTRSAAGPLSPASCTYALCSCRRHATARLRGRPCQRGLLQAQSGEATCLGRPGTNTGQSRVPLEARRRCHNCEGASGVSGMGR